MNDKHRATAAPISQRVNAERLVLLGWTRAILLQFSHPLIAAGIHEHSSFRMRPSAAVQRLRHTVRAMLALTFGDAQDRQRTLDRIAAIHRRVNGRLPKRVGPFPAGTPYSAEDPKLLLWVHATLIESVPMFYELLVAPLSADERDAYCANAGPLAVALGAEPAAVPGSWPALQTYLDAMHGSDEIVVGEQARELADALLAPPFGPLAAPGTYVNRLLTVGTLPASIREQYGLGWNARDARRFDRLVPGIRRLRAITPDVLATWRAARRRRRGLPPAARNARAGTGLDQRR